MSTVLIIGLELPVDMERACGIVEDLTKALPGVKILAIPGCSSLAVVETSEEQP